MTRYLDDRRQSKAIAERMLADIIRAQPCKYMSGEWLEHPSGEVGKVIEDLGQKVHVLCLGCFLFWDKAGLRMVAEP